LRSQLNQIRLWVRQGRTDAWIAHKLDISVGQLEQFKREHLSEPEPVPAETAVAPDEEPEAPEPEDEDEPEAEPEDEDELEEDEVEPAAADSETPDRTRRRRRGRRGGRRRGGARPRVSYEATFDHGVEGYGLWLDPAVAESQVYVQHWAGHRAVNVTVEADTITIRRIGGDENTDQGPEES
jgi:hypothetical protein